MRVLNVLFDERYGGPQSRVLQVARALRSGNIETVVAIAEGDPFFATQLQREGIECRQMPLVRLRKSYSPVPHLRYLSRFKSNIEELRRLIREKQIGLVHTNGVQHFQAAIAARMERVPVVWHVNDVNAGALLATFFGELVKGLSNVIAIASEAVGLHYFGRNWRSNRRIRVLYPPVDTHRFDGRHNGDALRSELGIGPDAPVIGAVGTVAPGKGFEFLLEAAPAILREFPDTRFVVAGAPLDTRPRYWEMLQEMRDRLNLRREFHFLGRRMDTPCIFSALATYVHPSEAEAVSMAVMEAAASGRPVVASRVGGIPEVVRDGETGILVPPRSAEAIAQAVLKLLRAPEAAREMGKRGARIIDESFSLRACIHAHRQVYCDACDESL